MDEHLRQMFGGGGTQGDMPQTAMAYGCNPWLAQFSTEALIIELQRRGIVLTTTQYHTGPYFNGADYMRGRAG